MLAVLNNWLAKPTIANVLIASIWIQAAGITAMAIVDGPYDPLTGETREPESVQVAVKFSGTEQVESVESAAIELPASEPDQTEPPEELPLFESKLAPSGQPTVDIERSFLARIELPKQATSARPDASNSAAEPNTAIEPPSKHLRRAALEAREPQPKDETRPRTTQRQRPPTDEFKPPMPTVSVPQSLGTDEVTPPTFTNNRPPAYPAAAYQAGIEGEVLLELHVSKSGVVEQVKIRRSSGHRILDDAARDAVKSWRGTPAQKNGRAVATVERLPVRFQLRPR